MSVHFKKEFTTKNTKIKQRTQKELQLARSREARPCGLPDGSRSGGCYAERMFYKKILSTKNRSLLSILSALVLLKALKFYI